MAAGPSTRTVDSVPPLRSLYIYVTNECNQHCPHCWIMPAQEGHGGLGAPSLSDYLGFIDAARPLGLKYVKVTGGEPLLRRETFSILQHTAQAGISSTLETNAMLIGGEEVSFLAQHKIHVGLSLDGASAEVHDRRRGLIGAFERTMHGLGLLAAVGVPFTVTCAVSRGNLGEIEKILELLSEVETQSQITFKINPIVPMGRALSITQRADTLEPHELLQLAETVGRQLLPRFSRYGLRIMLQLEPAFFPIDVMLHGRGLMCAHHCGFLNLISVLADGCISLCGVGYTQRQLAMGNIRNNYNLMELWNTHPTLAETRRTVRRRLTGACAHCLFHPICLGGCRAAAITADGSLASSSPWCQALYDAGLFPTTRLTDQAAQEYQRTAPLLRTAYEARTCFPRTA